MRVVIVGAGEVGTTTASNLEGDHEVVIVERDARRADEIMYKYDVLTIEGDGTSLSTLERAGAGDSEMLIACTDDDQANLVACGTAKALDDPFTIARVKSAEYLETWERSRGAFGVDFILCSDLLTAENIVRVIGLPGAVDVDPFAGGLIQMAELDIDPESPVAGLTVAEADEYDSLTFAGLFRNGNLTLPRGPDRIQAGDRAVVIGSPASVQSFATHASPEAAPQRDIEIVIVGGSEIGYHAARLLIEQGFRPSIIEQDYERARWLAEELPDATVLEHDATDTEFLNRQHVDEADLVISALGSDEKNMLVSVLAKRLGAGRVVSIVESGDYVPLFEQIGTDIVLNPRQVIAEEITRFTYGKAAKNISRLENDQAEVLEIELSPESPLVGHKLQELTDEIEGRFVVGAITRGRELVTPRGATVLEAGDHLVVFVETPYVGDFIDLA